MENKSLEMAKLAIAALEDKKAEDIKVIDISEVSVIADYFIIAGGSNRSQIQALCDNVDEQLGRAGFYAKQMSLYLRHKKELWKAQALVPVPLHRKKKKKRGYNQAELIARELSAYWGIPVITDLVIRCKNTKPMKGIVGTDRQNNLKKAFKLGTNDVKLSTIIIIDDIYTTGSTIDAVAKVCVEAGIKNVYFMTVSIGHGL